MLLFDCYCDIECGVVNNKGFLDRKWTQVVRRSQDGGKEDVEITINKEELKKKPIFTIKIEVQPLAEEDLAPLDRAQLKEQLDQIFIKNGVRIVASTLDSAYELFENAEKRQLKAVRRTEDGEGFNQTFDKEKMKDYFGGRYVFTYSIENKHIDGAVQAIKDICRQSARQSSMIFAERGRT
jgi:hypothetical protein